MSKKDTIKQEAGLGSPAPRSIGDDYLDQWEARRRETFDRQEDELLTGPSRFHVSHPGDPTRLVGAADRTEAVTKYRGYFGIVQSSHEFSVREAAEADNAAEAKNVSPAAT
jgi:hypothetical protein